MCSSFQASPRIFGWSLSFFRNSRKRLEVVPLLPRRNIEPSYIEIIPEGPPLSDLFFLTS